MRNKGRICLVDNCEKPAICKGYCPQHYKTVKNYGRTYLVYRRPGTGNINHNGYLRHRKNGRQKFAHVVKAEKALGKPLPRGAVVHHLNGNPLDNDTPLNLIICPNQLYHMLLHKRTKERGAA